MWGERHQETSQPKRSGAPVVEGQQYLPPVGRARDFPAESRVLKGNLAYLALSLEKSDSFLQRLGTVNGETERQLAAQGD